MRSPSRDRRHVRDRGAEYRDRNRDGRGADRHRDYGSRRSASRSRSRSRDRARPRGRDAVADGSREMREVKRILSASDGATRQDRNNDPRQSTRDGNSNGISDPRKKSYSEYSGTERSRTDDDAKAKRGRYGESDFKGVDGKDKDKEKENNRDNEESKGKADAPKEADEQYDEVALKEIESFLASTVREKTERGNAGGKAASAGAGNDQGADESDDDLAVVWEDEEEKAKREALEAEERRRKRQEIASKYSAGSVPTSPVAARSSSALSPGSGTRKRAHTAPESMEKASIVTVQSSLASVDNNNNGSSSISVPTASIHLSKLALSGEGGEAEAEAHSGSAHDVVHQPLVGSAVAAAVRAVLPAADKHATSGDLPSPAAVVTEQDAEGRQLEAEKSALEQEERREQRGASKGYGGGYGAGGRVEFDMFSASPSGIEHQMGRKGYIGANGKYADTGVGGRRALREALLDGEPHGLGAVAEGEDPHLQSNWDDGEGYYKARIGELVGDRFQILGVVGKGVFATVLKCVDLRAGDGTTNVAVKMIRNNDTMRKAAEKEKSILLSIVEHDPDNKKFCVRLLTHLEYRNHVALVFEYQSMNLRETLKKFGKDVGINIGAVRMYGRQLFVALKHLMDLRIVHADIKLDNILCSADLKQVKLCDFGSAFRETDTDNDPTPYLVSRFYRAPEIILGMQYDRAIDLWSVCTSLYELFTGHVMFPGRTNNEMLRLMMAVKGRFPNKLIKTHMRAYEVLSLEPHFDPDLRFRQYEADPITGKTVLRLIDVTNPTRDLAAVLRSSKAGADDLKVVANFTDFLEKGLTLDPAKRMTVVDAFRHPFLSSK